MKEILWVDSHCHPQYENLGLESIEEALENGISKICCVAAGESFAEHDFLMKCKEKYNTAIVIGEHPTNDFAKTDWNFLESVILNYNAIGETGFDFQSEIEPQIEAFERQANLALKYDLPVVLHIRDAGDGKIEELTMQELKKFPNLRGVFHCFVGGKKLAQFAIDRNFFISFSGIITFKKAEAIRDLMKTLPVENFLIETDAPYLAPVPKRGKINRPSYVKYVGEFISQFLNIKEEVFSEIVNKNFDKLYWKS
ncbi:TatD family hydrolase [Alphaproteobacteria bacterium endosymbiont of Tiliacea citrago]|uniref:TatD family hydrolase n=1 Tax=Alphaproteobacteria bacterium endosymbiont of Tiliacea citrago TaxID=3077944 RepID=UPI00313E4B85